MQLGPKGVAAFENRMIDPETAVRYGVYTARRGDDGSVVPDASGNIIAFPFFEHGRSVAEKYRGPGKQFWQRKDGRRTFWNSDALDDPALEQGTQALIITEGELDALTAIDCGFPLSVSVPDGAPSCKEGERPDDLAPIDRELEAKGKFEYLWNNRDRLKRVKKFILAVDNDLPGQRLAAELVRRLLPSRCRFVVYPAGCKDLNDVKRARGSDGVASVLNSARDYPVRGLYHLSDYPNNPELVTYSTGWPALDQSNVETDRPVLKLFLGELMLVTGIPSHGKSAWCFNLVVNVAMCHGWRAVIYSPEMPTVPHVRGILRKIVRQVVGDGNIDQFIDEHILFIDSDPVHGPRDDDGDFSLEWIVDRAVDAVHKVGARLLIIDPWNEVEHARQRNENVTDYVGRCLRMLKRIAKQYQIVVVVVAHPTKDVGRTDDGTPRKPTLYDVEGSMHWFGKPDHGVMIFRPANAANVAEIYVQKARFRETGNKEMVRMEFDTRTFTFKQLRV